MYVFLLEYNPTCTQNKLIKFSVFWTIYSGDAKTINEVINYNRKEEMIFTVAAVRCEATNAMY